MNGYYGRRLSPADIKFTQDSVAMCFQNDTEINAALEEIAKGSLAVTSFPKIRIRDQDGEYYR